MFEQEVRWPTAARWLLYGTIVVLMLPVVRVARRPGGIGILIGTAIVVAVLGVFLEIFTTLRIRIDAESLTVGFGPFQERVPRRSIVECAPSTYRWQEWGGIGFRLRREGRLYNVVGDGGLCVRLRLANGQLLLFSSSDPRAVCRALSTDVQSAG